MRKRASVLAESSAGDRMRSQRTCRRLPELQDRTMSIISRELEIRVALDQLLGAVILEADGELAIFAFALDSR